MLGELGMFFGGLGLFFLGSAAIWWVSLQAKQSRGNDR